MGIPARGHGVAIGARGAARRIAHLDEGWLRLRCATPVTIRTDESSLAQGTAPPTSSRQLCPAVAADLPLRR